MKFANITSKIIAAIVFVLLIAVLSIPDYQVSGMGSQQNSNVITASSTHNKFMGNTNSSRKSL
jgi:hypothetical protein